MKCYHFIYIYLCNQCIFKAYDICHLKPDPSWINCFMCGTQYYLWKPNHQRYLECLCDCAQYEALHSNRYEINVAICFAYLLSIKVTLLYRSSDTSNLSAYNVQHITIQSLINKNNCRFVICVCEYQRSMYVCLTKFIYSLFRTIPSCLSYHEQIMAIIYIYIIYIYITVCYKFVHKSQ